MEQIWIKEPYKPKYIASKDEAIYLCNNSPHASQIHGWIEGMQEWKPLEEVLFGKSNRKSSISYPPEFKSDKVIYSTEADQAAGNPPLSGAKNRIENRENSSARVIPKIAWAIIIVGLLSFMGGLYGCIDRSPIAVIRCGLLCGLTGVGILGWFSSLWICGSKGRKIFYAPGIAALVLILNSKGSFLLILILLIFPVIGAVIPVGKNKR